MAEPRHRIRLEDLVREEALRVSRTAVPLIPRAQTPTDAMLLAVVGRLDQDGARLRAMMFDGCRLAGADQEDFFVQALRLMPPKIEVYHGTTYRAWTDLMNYPMSGALYAAALGALAARKWGLLHKLLVMSFPAFNTVGRASRELAAIRALPEEAAKLVMPGKKTPASTHFFNIIDSLAADYVPDVDELFDELEVWIGLAAADCYQPELGSGCFVPPGRFMWKGSFGGSGQRHPDLTFAAAEQAGDGWEPLLKGWFGGDATRFATAKSRFQERVREMAQFFY